MNSIHVKNKNTIGPAIAYVSTYPPRQCGIATFTQDLLEAVDSYKLFPPARVVAVSNAQYAYEPRVVYQIYHDEEDSYLEAADYLNSFTDLVVLQHEFGIFGGPDGELVLRLLGALRQPIITVFHSVLRRPDFHKERLVREISKRSSTIVVMAERGRIILEERYGVPGYKINVLHHGVPEPNPCSREELKTRHGLENRRVISTFGLLNPGKGIEHALLALTRVVPKHPEAVYLVLGQTHPVVRKFFGESYRDKLMAMVRELALTDNVRFVGTYLSKEQLLEYLAMTDIYLTPYPNPEQICSGTLAYAVSLGKAIVSTPYLYAQEILGDGRGLLVPFADPGAMAEALNAILDSPALQDELENAALRFGAVMRWPKVARDYIGLYSQILRTVAVRTGITGNPLGSWR